MAFVSSIFRLCRSSPNVPSRKRCAIRCGPALQPVSKRTQRERARRSTCRDTQHCAHPRVCERVHASTRSVGILNCTKDVVPMAALHGAAVQFEMYCILGKGLLQDATTIVVARFHCNERHCNERRWNRFSRDRYFPHDHARTQLIPLHCGEEPENGGCACRSAKTLSRIEPAAYRAAGSATPCASARTIAIVPSGAFRHCARALDSAARYQPEASQSPSALRRMMTNAAPWLRCSATT